MNTVTLTLSTGNWELLCSLLSSEARSVCAVELREAEAAYARHNTGSNLERLNRAAHRLASAEGLLKIIKRQGGRA